MGDSTISVKEAREILGDEAKNMTDNEIARLIESLDAVAKATLRKAITRREALNERLKNLKTTTSGTLSASIASSGASLIAPGAAASFDVKSYLEPYIDGYLLCDLESIAYTIPSDKHPGAAGYPLILTICAGMELLGALLRPSIKDKFNEDDGIKYFGHYWKHYLSKVDPEYEKYGEVARTLIRNGLAHLFMTKPRIGVVKSNPQYHLKKVEGHLIIDAVKLYEDFKKSYIDYAKPVLLDNQDGSILASNRLHNILAKYTIESDENLKKLLGKLDDNASTNTTTVPPTIG